MNYSPTTQRSNSLGRIRFWYALVIGIIVIFAARLFYLQVIKHDYYKTAALNSQLKEHEIPPVRGVIEAHSGDDILPLVLNEMKYTVFADPKFVSDPAYTAAEIQKIIGGDASDHEEKMRMDTRYSILAKKLSKEQKEQIDNLGLKGIGTRETPYRTYPQGKLAAQILGFVNDDGVGSYGLEEALDHDLKGAPGQLKAITDADGVPLVTNEDNVITQPVQGKRVVLTIDLSMQKQLEDILKAGLDRAKSKSGSALIMDPKTGAIKAMANFPTFDPTTFYEVKDANVFTNAAVSAPLEVGSVMKPLTLAAALNLGVVNENTTYYDPGEFKIDNETISNVEEVRGSGTRSMLDIIKFSLNTGATWLLTQMGGGEINEKARVNWHEYMANRYNFGKLTGVEQGYEAPGTVPDPREGFGLGIRYANTAFGQGMTATPLQMGAALSSVVNGGIYYKPHVVESVDGVKPESYVVNGNVVSDGVSKTVRKIMAQAFDNNHALYGMPTDPAEYTIGSKSGTPQVANPNGGYYEDRYNGMMIGFVGGNEPEYVIVVRVNEPRIFGYAGSRAAGPLFSDLATMLVRNFGVTPKGN